MSLKPITNKSLTRVCEISHTARLVQITAFHPHRCAAKNANGVKNELEIYRRRMSINRGRNNRTADPTRAAAGFCKYWSSKLLTPGNWPKKKLPITKAKENVRI